MLSAAQGRILLCCCSDGKNPWKKAEFNDYRCAQLLLNLSALQLLGPSVHQDSIRGAYSWLVTQLTVANPMPMMFASWQNWPYARCLGP
jgi:hypothetical protein